MQDSFINFILDENNNLILNYDDDLNLLFEKITDDLYWPQSLSLTSKTYITKTDNQDVIIKLEFTDFENGTITLKDISTDDEISYTFTYSFDDFNYLGFINVEDLHEEYRFIISTDSKHCLLDFYSYIFPIDLIPINLILERIE